MCLARKVDYDFAQSRNDVKVVFDRNRDALFFSREPIPSKWLGDKEFPYYSIVVVPPYRRHSLEKYASLESTDLKTIESIDMLRFLENGIKIRIVESPYESYSVDTPEDVELVEKVLKTDTLHLQLFGEPHGK